MKNFIDDLRTAARAFNLAQKARKQGAVLQVQEAVNLPVLKLTGWASLLEGTLFRDKETDAAVRAAFYRLNPEIQRNLIRFTPKTSRGWLERAQFWREILEPALPTKMYHEAMIRLCSWYRHCINMKKGGRIGSPPICNK